MGPADMGKRESGALVRYQERSVRLLVTTLMGKTLLEMKLLNLFL